MRKFEAIRTEIKTLSQEQKEVKPLRKPSNSFNGLNPANATYVVAQNKYELRHLFQAYAILKGVERPEVKKPSNYNGWVLDQKKVDQMVEKYRPVEISTEVHTG